MRYNSCKGMIGTGAAAWAAIRHLPSANYLCLFPSYTCSGLQDFPVSPLSITREYSIIFAAINESNLPDRSHQHKEEAPMAIAVGQSAPDFSLKDQYDKDVKLSDFAGNKNVVIVFYPLDWSPVCTKEHACFV